MVGVTLHQVHPTLYIRNYDLGVSRASHGMELLGISLNRQFGDGEGSLARIQRRIRLINRPQSSQLH
jgi:hypothetical protein